MSAPVPSALVFGPPDERVAGDAGGPPAASLPGVPFPREPSNRSRQCVKHMLSDRQVLSICGSKHFRILALTHGSTDSREGFADGEEVFALGKTRE